MTKQLDGRVIVLIALVVTEMKIGLLKAENKKRLITKKIPNELLRKIYSEAFLGLLIAATEITKSG